MKSLCKTVLLNLAVFEILLTVQVTFAYLVIKLIVGVGGKKCINM